jgi:hypothetical protein
MTADQCNAAFEFIGALLILNHARCGFTYGLSGVSMFSTVIFTLWGVWNLFYYPSLGQYYSFVAGICVIFANVIWINVIIRYRIKARTD